MGSELTVAALAGSSILLAFAGLLPLVGDARGVAPVSLPLALGRGESVAAAASGRADTTSSCTTSLVFLLLLLGLAGVGTATGTSAGTASTPSSCTTSVVFFLWLLGLAEAGTATGTSAGTASTPSSSSRTDWAPFLLLLGLLAVGPLAGVISNWLQLCLAALGFPVGVLGGAGGLS